MMFFRRITPTAAAIIANINANPGEWVQGQFELRNPSIGIAVWTANKDYALLVMSYTPSDDKYPRGQKWVPDRQDRRALWKACQQHVAAWKADLRCTIESKVA